MCPIWPLHLIIMYLLAMCPLWCFCQYAAKLTATFDPHNVTLGMDDSFDVHFNISGLQPGVTSEGDVLQIRSLRDDVADAKKYRYALTKDDIASGHWSGIFKLNGNTLGKTEVYVSVQSPDNDGVEKLKTNPMPVIVKRPERLIDHIFVASVAILVSLICINFGCAMHWPTVKAVFKKPIGPIIGLGGQFLLMPIISFLLGLVIFPNNPGMRLGMFFTGVSPAGGASNIWTFILGGNLNMSLAMTTISTLAAFGLIPAWIFSLGRYIFADAKLEVPYLKIAYFVAGLILPLGIGLSMQRFTPRVAAFMVRILKGLSTTLLVFIIVFAIVANFYIFKLFTYQIVIAGMGIPWLGYMVGYVTAKVFRQPHADALAISIETGVQNTGIAILLLKIALSSPESDIATVIPVSVAIMTPIPMTCIYLYQKIKGCIVKNYDHTKTVEETKPFTITPDSSISTIKTNGYTHDKMNGFETDDEFKSNNNIVV